MDEYAGRVLADRYRLPLLPGDEFEPAEIRAFDTYSGQEVLVRQVPLPEVVDAEMLDESGAGTGFGGGPAGDCTGDRTAGRTAGRAPGFPRRGARRPVPLAGLPNPLCGGPWRRRSPRRRFPTTPGWTRSSMSSRRADRSGW